MRVFEESACQSICDKTSVCIILQRMRSEIERLKNDHANFMSVLDTAREEFAKRNKKIEQLKEEINMLKETLRQREKEIQDKHEEIKKTKAKCNLLTKMVFDKNRSNKETVSTKRDKKKGGAVPGHKGSGRKIPENLEIEEEIIEIPEEERVCAVCGLPYKETGLEDCSSEICVKKTYYVKKTRRKIYKKSCDCGNPIITAKMPVKLIPKGKFGLEFWVDALINKYKNHLPIQRQVSDMLDYGLSVSTGTIFSGFKKIYFRYIERLYIAMGTQLRSSNQYHADESGWKLFVKIDDKENYNWFMWVFISKEIVLFVLDPTRSTNVVGKALFNIEKEEMKMLDMPNNSSERKTLTVDKFSSYKKLERLGLVKITYCWSHQRREFIDAKTKYPGVFENWADSWIERIADLYHINNQRIMQEVGSPTFAKYDTQLRVIIDEMESLISMEYIHPGQSAVINSMKAHWKGLTVFVNRPEIPMDNNIAERMLRHAVIGRKNYWGNHSEWTGNLTSAMFSIIQTCLINDISPREYLTCYLKECSKRGSAPDEFEIESFLPHKLSENFKSNIRAGPV